MRPLIDPQNQANPSIMLDFYLISVETNINYIYETITYKSVYLPIWALYHKTSYSRNKIRSVLS
jgi:hypothetical protein